MDDPAGPRIFSPAFSRETEMKAETLLAALVLFQLKHLIADFALQTPAMIRAKGKYGHPGGLLHAAIHVLASAPILAWIGVAPLVLLGLLAAEFVLHYHIDWGKERLGRAASLAPDRRLFWLAFGADQALHQLTYIGILWVIII